MGRYEVYATDLVTKDGEVFAHGQCQADAEKLVAELNALHERGEQAEALAEGRRKNCEALEASSYAKDAAIAALLELLDIKAARVREILAQHAGAGKEAASVSGDITDTQRLDFLETKSGTLGYSFLNGIPHGRSVKVEGVFHAFHGADVRAAIDAAKRAVK